MNRSIPGEDASARRPPRSVVLVTHSHYPDDIRNEKEALALRDAGFRVTVFCLRRGRQPMREWSEGIEVRRIPIEHKRGGAARYLFEYLGFFLLVGWSLSLLAIARRPVAVQVSNPPDPLVFVALVPRLLGSRVVLDMHEPVPELYASIRRAPLTSPGIRALAWAEGLATRFASHVVTVSEACRETFTRRGTPREKITVVPNVCEARIFDPSRYSSADSGEPGGGPLRLIYHGTLVPRYGVDIAVRAMATIRERVPDARLIVYGRGEFAAEIERLARDLGVADVVEMGGFVPLDRIPEKIAQASVGIVPNRKDIFTDLVLPTKLFEYVAMGKPVVASRTAALLAHFGEEDLYLFDAEDSEGLARAVAAVHADPAQARARAERLRIRCAGERWEVVRGLYVSVYDGIA